MSCLFVSIGYFLNLSHKDVRNSICNYLENNGKLINDVDTKTLLKIENSNYISKMKKEKTWGGGIEIQCACNIWNLKIIVLNIRDNTKNIEFIPINNKINKIIKITWNGNHYEPVKI